MQVTIDVPDNMPRELLQQKIKEIEDGLKKEAELLQQKQNTLDGSNIDPWDALDVETIAINTGRIDGSENHDYYIYGQQKE